MPPSASSPSSGQRGARKRQTYTWRRKLAAPGRKRREEHKARPVRQPRAKAPGKKLMGRTEPRLFTPHATDRSPGRRASGLRSSTSPARSARRSCHGRSGFLSMLLS